MPRYYFDTQDGQKCIDQDGEVLESDAAAQMVAGQIASELTPTRIAHLWKGEPFQVVIRDSEKAVLGYVIVMAASPP